MSRRSWAFAALSLLGVGVAVGRAVLRESPSRPLVNPVPEPYRPRAPSSCAAWLGDELLTTFTDGGRAVEDAEGVWVRNLSGAAWIHDLPEGRVLAVVSGEALAPAAEVAPGLVVVTSPDPVVALLADGGRAVWVSTTDGEVARALSRVALDGSTSMVPLTLLPAGTSRVHAVLEDGTLLVAGRLGELGRARVTGERVPLPEPMEALGAPTSEDGRWLTDESGAAALVEVRWDDPPEILRRVDLPGSPVRVRADADGPVALVSGADGRLVLWWLDAEGGHTHALPWTVHDGCLALRGARVGVVAHGRAWALDRQTGAAWTP